jgi:hypothetical protein
VPFKDASDHISLVLLQVRRSSKITARIKRKLAGIHPRKYQGRNVPVALLIHPIGCTPQRWHQDFANREPGHLCQAVGKQVKTEYFNVIAY